MPEEELDRWLASARRGLDEEIAATLDVEAGLRDVLLPARRTAFDNDLGAVLNVDAGLAAIIPGAELDAERPRTPEAETRQDPGRPERQGKGQGRGQGKGEGATVRLLTSLPAAERLALRGDPAVIRLSVTLQAARASGLASLLGETSAQSPDNLRTRTYARLLTHELTEIITLVGASGFAGAYDLLLYLNRALARARTLAEGLAQASGSGSAGMGALDLDFALEGVLLRALDLEPVRALARVLGLDPARTIRLDRALHDDLDHLRDDPHSDPVRELDTALNDFREMDLREIDLAGIPLTGVRWSEGTRWPLDWQERIEQRSVEMNPGVFEIRDGGMEHADMSSAPVGW